MYQLYKFTFNILCMKMLNAGAEVCQGKLEKRIGRV